MYLYISLAMYGGTLLYFYNMSMFVYYVFHKVSHSLLLAGINTYKIVDCTWKWVWVKEVQPTIWSNNRCWDYRSLFYTQTFMHVKFISKPIKTYFAIKTKKKKIINIHPIQAYVPYTVCVCVYQDCIGGMETFILFIHTASLFMFNEYDLRFFSISYRICFLD